MFESCEPGVLYTEYTSLTAKIPGLASFWSYETCSRGDARPSVALNPEGNHEYWLERSDPLLNTILPGTGVSLVVNFGDMWTASRSLAASTFLARVCVVGPVTRPRILRLGRSIRAVGSGLSSTMALYFFGVPASMMVDQIVPLQELWTSDDVERLFASLAGLGIRRCVSALKDELLARTCRLRSLDTIGGTASRLIKLRAGCVSIDSLASSHGLSRQQFTRRFRAAAGLPPKLFARITRFQALVHTLLSTDVSEWASVSPALGFYDQAHMINEFRAFAGSPPTVFFRPHGVEIAPARFQIHGRPSEWLRWPEPLISHDSFAPV